MDLLHLGEERNHFVSVVYLIVFHVQRLELRKLEKLLAGLGVWNQILLEIKVFQVYETFKTLNFLDHVAGEVDGYQACEGMKTFDLFDGILMKIDHLKLFQALKIFNFGNTVALEPNAFDV